jgi:acetyl/propionyl-CoA carboxylase alpha subunit
MPAEHDVPAYMLPPWGWGCRLLHEASQLGFPLLVKAVSGGGGKGMKLAMNMKVSVMC